MRFLIRSFLVAVVLSMGTACATQPVPYPKGLPSVYEDPTTVGRAMGTGVESQDIVGMTDQMARDILADPVLAGRATPPRVIIDEAYFTNSSSERLNKRLITNRLRVELNRAARGRMVFVARHRPGMAESERAAKREGLVDAGALPLTKAPLGGDYRLSGEFADHVSEGLIVGQIAHYTQAIFELIDLETNELVWSGIYEYRKSSLDHVVYR